MLNTVRLCPKRPLLLLKRWRRKAVAQKLHWRERLWREALVVVHGVLDHCEAPVDGELPLKVDDALVYARKPVALVVKVFLDACESRLNDG